MTPITPLPKRTRELVQKHKDIAHPGLWLDKYAKSFDPDATESGKLQEHVQKPTIEHVVGLSQRVPAGLDFAALRARWQTGFSAEQIARFEAQTIGPLTLHLARASALENAGLCLHPVYGFAYLPGSGLKGMARAYAETVWVPTQFTTDSTGQPANDAAVKPASDAWNRIETVFGWAPGSDVIVPRTPKPWKPTCVPKHGAGDSAASGQIVFHDAWPTSWPKLIVDIVNNHHQDYYSAGDNEQVPPPGDWENPVPVNFLAVPDGVRFEFAVSKRRDDVRGDLLDLASQWLAGALTHLGAGAKTAAGYGSFRIDSLPPTPPTLVADVQTTWDAAKQSKARAEFSCTLELATPAFLAGASHDDPTGCDLRPATLRGHLRWWWRALHAGHVDTATLRRIEAAIWGDTNSGGAVRVTVEPLPNSDVVVVEAPFKKPGKTKKGDDKLDFDEAFAKQHDIDLGPAMTTRPLGYLAYGMDELVKQGGKKVRRRRWCVWPGAKWQVRVTARMAKLEVRDGQQQLIETVVIPASTCLTQARATLWLLAQFGGVGSKCRKGFGSLALDEETDRSVLDLTLEACCQAAAELRGVCKVPPTSSAAESSAIDAMQILAGKACNCDYVEMVTPWKNPWYALDQLGAVLQSFAQDDAASGHGKHCESKLALGLPRQVHGPLDFKLPHQNTHKPPKQLIGPKGDRHASPVHFHFGRTAGGGLIVRAAAFPAPHLPNLEDSEQLLKQLLKHVSSDLHARVNEYRNRGQAWPVAPSGATGVEPSAAPPPSRPQLPKPGDMVDAVLLEERTKKGGWRAKHVATEICGPIQNSTEVPADKKAGETLTLRVQSANEREIAFRYPTAGDQTKGKSGRKK